MLKQNCHRIFIVPDATWGDIENQRAILIDRFGDINRWRWESICRGRAEGHGFLQACARIPAIEIVLSENIGGRQTHFQLIRRNVKDQDARSPPSPDEQSLRRRIVQEPCGAIHAIRPETWIVGVEIGLADDPDRGHAGLDVLRTDVEHHYAIVSGIGNEEAIVRVVVENAAGVIQLRVAGARNFRGEIGLAYYCD